MIAQRRPPPYQPAAGPRPCPDPRQPPGNNTPTALSVRLRPNMLPLARTLELSLLLDIVLIVKQALDQLDGVVDLGLESVDNVLGGGLDNRSLGGLGGGGGLGDNGLGLRDAVDANQLRLEDCRMVG